MRLPNLTSYSAYSFPSVPDYTFFFLPVRMPARTFLPFSMSWAVQSSSSGRFTADVFRRYVPQNVIIGAAQTTSEVATSEQNARVGILEEKQLDEGIDDTLLLVVFVPGEI